MARSRTRRGIRFKQSPIIKGESTQYNRDNSVFGPGDNPFSQRNNIFGPQHFQQDPQNEQVNNQAPRLDLENRKSSKKNKALFGIS